MKDKIAIAVAGCWLATWVAYMVVYPNPNAVQWGESQEVHAQKAMLEASRHLATPNTTIASK